MYEWREAKVGSSLRRAFLVANDIAWIMEDEKIRSAYVLFAAMHDTESIIAKCFEDMNMSIMCVNVNAIANDRELYEKIFGKEAAENFFEKAQEENSDSTAIDGENMEIEDDEIKNKVLEVISELAADIDIYEDQMELMKPNYSDKLEMACDKALEISNAMGKDYIDLDVLLYCILQNKETSAYKYMSNFLPLINIKVDDFINSIRVSANIRDLDDNRIIQIKVPASLETCIEVLNDKYTKGEECVILGRDKEIFKAFNIFSKKTKRNAVLVGHPGVGKTAIMEAITQAIVNETCPKEFIGYTVLSLDINSMIAGTKYRGEFETKVAILKQFLENTPKVILFVDEMHQMLGAGGNSEGSVDLSGSLKPVLSRDDVVFVGATTNAEYEGILSRDGAFKRRFEVINIKEPKNGEVKLMIKAKISSMEKYHGVKIPNKLIDYIILCSTCFNMENHNPDRTLDLCDRSMAIAKMENKKQVTKTDIDKVYEEFFEQYSKLDRQAIATTAYHEIGHYIVTRLTKKWSAYSVTAISIIPGNDFLGVNILERKDNFVSSDMEFVEAYIMSCLAGRVAQQKISKNIDSGAREDLRKAKDFAKRVIAEFGMDDEEYKNIYLMDEDLFNEKMAAKIDEKVNQLIKRLYVKTEEFVDTHWKEIDAMAKYLMKNKIVTSDELERFIEK